MSSNAGIRARGTDGRRLPLIGITCLHQVAKPPAPDDKLRISISYIRSVVRAGGAPVCIPMMAEPEDLNPLLEQLDGIVLSGGDDYPGELFGEETHPSALLEDPQRVAIEPKIARWVLEKELPTLAVCMGIQTLALAYGGRLIQDIPTWFEDEEKQAGERNEIIPHRIGDGEEPAFHDVRVESGNRLHDILDVRELEVNSYHHQAVAPMETWEKNTPDFRVVARSADGVIEGAVIPGHRWCVGVQWHPERLYDRPEHLCLFEALVRESSA